jgi:hypothetical protein
VFLAENALFLFGFVLLVEGFFNETERRFLNSRIYKKTLKLNLKKKSAKIPSSLINPNNYFYLIKLPSKTDNCGPRKKKINTLFH